MIITCTHPPTVTRLDSAHSFTLQLCDACAAHYDANAEIHCGHADALHSLWMAERWWLLCHDCYVERTNKNVGRAVSDFPSLVGMVDEW